MNSINNFAINYYILLYFLFHLLSPLLVLLGYYPVGWHD